MARAACGPLAKPPRPPGRRPNGHVAIVGISDNPPTTVNYVNYIAFRGTGHTYCPDSCGCPTELISGEYPECDIRYCRCPDQCACNCCQGCADRANSEMEFTC